MDSKLDPINVQDQYRNSVQKAVGYEGVLREGEALFIPAGTWHYIESYGLNIALNYFFHAREGALWNQSPLKEYKIKVDYLYPMLKKASKIKHALTRS